MRKILVVEDETKLRELLVRVLGETGYHVTGVGSGREAVTIAVRDEYDLVLLDLNLPDISGEDVLRAIRAADTTTRVLVLSASTGIGRRIQVLESGAVDFMLKPFITAELLVRIKLRLAGDPGGRRTSSPGRLSVADDVYVDVGRRELVLGSERVALSAREFTLLSHLIGRRGSTCSREELLSDVWGLSFDPGTNVVDVYIRRLRAKLTIDAIETVRNVGYRLVAS